MMIYNGKRTAAPILSLALDQYFLADVPPHRFRAVFVDYHCGIAIYYLLQQQHECVDGYGLH